MTLCARGPRFRLRVAGTDAVDLLHRVTSNEVRGLNIGATNHQCLLTAKGKIVSVFDLERLADGAILEGTLELLATTRDAIDRYIIMEQVVIEELPSIEAAPESEDERIRSGEARWGVDIDAETIPYEAGLQDWVSTSKGCYTGQETIARIETYGQVARRLCRLSSAAADRPAAGALSLEGEVVGRLTSVTSGHDADLSWHGLGMLRRSAWPQGTTLAGPDLASWTVLG